MRRALDIVLVLVFLVATGCCPCKNVGVSAVVDKVERDSIYINHYDTMRIVERDTMWLERIEQSHDRVMAKASHSYLENAYCTSSADVSEEGILTHTLDTRDSALMPVRVQRVEHIVRDTVVRWRTNNRAEVKVKEVVRTAWYDKALRWVSLGLLAIVIWQNRKLFIKFLKLWI